MKAYTVIKKITLTVEAGSIVMLDEKQASRNASSLEEKRVRREETPIESFGDSENRTRTRRAKRD